MLSNVVGAKRVEVEGSLFGRIVVVTGVSRRAGIGFAIAQRQLADGASVVVHSWSAHDAAQPWGGDPGGIEAVLAALGGVGARLRHFEADLGDPGRTTAAHGLSDRQVWFRTRNRGRNPALGGRRRLEDWREGRRRRVRGSD
jgi:hypothetical protein